MKPAMVDVQSRTDGRCLEEAPAPTRARMIPCPARFRRCPLAALALLAGCVGFRTPLDDAGAPRGDAADMGVAFCGSTLTIDTRPVPADVLIVLDRSESMIWSLTANATCAAGAAGCTTRAEAVVSAIGDVVTENPDIRWGLQLFPATSVGTCSVSATPQVGISASSAAAIKAELAAFTTSLSTPTAATLTAAVAYLKTVGDHANKAILLATDGLPNCPAGGDWATDDMTGATRAATAAKQAGFPVYVVGIGPSVSNLNTLAVAGGTGSYYPATSITTLNTALRTIAKVVTTTCRLEANTLPPDKDLVTVYVDKTLVSQDESNGWIFDPTDPTSATIVLTGDYCQSVLAGATAEVQIDFGCPDASSSEAGP